MREVIVSALYVYPVKSLRGVAVSRARVEARGLADDRRFLIVDDAGRFLTQREHPRLALVDVAIAESALTLQAPGMEPLQVERARAVVGPAEELDVVIWKDTCLAERVWPEASAYLSRYLGLPCTLVRMPERTRRKVDPAYARQPSDVVSFADAYPILIASVASLDDLNARAGTAERGMTMHRFRPNVVVTGGEAFEEGEWSRIDFPRSTLHLVKPSVRCVITTIDPLTAELGKEPLATLATFRRVSKASGGGGVTFGENAIPEAEGEVEVGEVGLAHARRAG